MKFDPHSARPFTAHRNWPYYLFVLFIAGVLSGCESLFEPSAESKKAKSVKSLKQFGLVITNYANDSKGQFPSLSPEWGQLVMDPNLVYPEYLSDPKIYISPAHPDARKLASLDDPKTMMRDHSYWYLGYAFIDEEAGLTFVEEYRKHAQEGSVLPGAFKLGPDTLPIFRLQESIARFYHAKPYDHFYSKSWAFPVMIERPGLQEGGSNVLFTDGRVEFMEYPGEFPMTERFIHALESLDDLK